jgi:hypothetical protein
MSKEIEAQILNIDYDEIINKIKNMGASMKFDWIKFRIGIFHPCLSLEEQKNKYSLIYTRVRDEGKGIVNITTKSKLKSSDSKFVNEYEIETKNSFDECKDLLVANHLSMKAYQERLRQKWYIPNRPEIKEIVFDIWPGLPMYMEIEAKTENDLDKFLTELHIDKKNIRYSGVSVFYNEILGVSSDTINNDTPILDFKSVGDTLKSSVSDEAKFNTILENQRELLKNIGFKDLLNGGKKATKKNDKKSSKKNDKKSSKKNDKKSSKKNDKKSSKKNDKKSSKKLIK